MASRCFVNANVVPLAVLPNDRGDGEVRQRDARISLRDPPDAFQSVIVPRKMPA